MSLLVINSINLNHFAFNFIITAINFLETTTLEVYNADWVYEEQLLEEISLKIFSGDGKTRRISQSRTNNKWQCTCEHMLLLFVPKIIIFNLEGIA